MKDKILKLLASDEFGMGLATLSTFFAGYMVYTIGRDKGMVKVHDELVNLFEEESKKEKIEVKNF